MNDDGGNRYVGTLDPFYQQTGAWIADAFTTRRSELRLELIDGINTIVVAGKNGGSGVALAQLFDADGSTNRMSNLSARVFAGTGEATAIIGFTIKGDAPRRVLIRCVGPSDARGWCAGEPADAHESEGVTMGHCERKGGGAGGKSRDNDDEPATPFISIVNHLAAVMHTGSQIPPISRRVAHSGPAATATATLVVGTAARFGERNCSLHDLAR